MPGGIAGRWRRTDTRRQYAWAWFPTPGTGTRHPVPTADALSALPCVSLLTMRVAEYIANTRAAGWPGCPGFIPAEASSGCRCHCPGSPRTTSGPCPCLRCAEPGGWQWPALVRALPWQSVNHGRAVPGYGALAASQLRARPPERQLSDQYYWP